MDTKGDLTAVDRIQGSFFKNIYGGFPTKGKKIRNLVKALWGNNEEGPDRLKKRFNTLPETLNEDGG